MKRRTVSADDLETMAFAAHAPIEPPGPEGGWATATINGHLYRARVGAVPACTCHYLDMGPRCDYCVSKCAGAGHPYTESLTNGQHHMCGVVLP